MPGEQNYLPKIGVDAFSFAKVKSDIPKKGSAPGKTEYEDTEFVPGTVSISFNPNSSIETFYADNGPYTAAAQMGNLLVDIDMADLPPALLAKFIGGTYVNGIYQPGGAKYPDMAIGFRIKKANEAYRYFWFYKGKVTMPAMGAEGQKDKPTYQSSKYQYSAVNRLSDGQPFRMLDDDDPNLPDGLTPLMIAENWFTSPNWIAAVSEPVQVPYTANGSITNIEPAEVAYNLGNFIVPTGTTTFTFTDDTTSKLANYNGTSWLFYSA